MFFRLFTLLEDQCHQLDLAMAESTSGLPGDRPAYTTYVAIVQQERELLDKKDTLDSELKWLEQTHSFLSLNSTNPATDPTLLAVARTLMEKRQKKVDMVSNWLHQHYGYL